MEKTIEQTWNSWTEEQKEQFVLKHCGSDEPMQRINAVVDSVSAYSVTSKKTKAELKKHFA